MATKTRKTRKTRNTNINATIASHLAQLAAGYADAEVATLADDAAFTAFAQAELTIGATGYASVPSTDRKNDYGSDIGGGIALAMRVLGLGDAAKVLQAREDAKLVSACLANDFGLPTLTIEAEMRAEDADAACAACATVSRHGFKCRTHSR